MVEYGSGDVPPGKYGTAGVGELRDELLTLCDHLAAAHVILAGHVADRERTYWAFYNKSDGQSVSARDKEAQAETLAWTCWVIEDHGHINALITKIDLLRYLLGVPTKLSMAMSFPPDKGLTA